MSFNFRDKLIALVTVIISMTLCVCLYGEERGDVFFLICRGDGIYLYDIQENTRNMILSLTNECVRVDLSSVRYAQGRLCYIIYDICEKNSNVKYGCVLRSEYGIYYQNIISGNYSEFEYIYDFNLNKSILNKEIRNEIKDNKWFITEILFQGGRDTLFTVKDELPVFELGGSRVEESRVINGMKVLSKDGDLYVLYEDSLKLLLDYKGDCSRKSSKFACGYCSPDLSSDGKKVISVYSDGLIGGRETVLVEIDIDTGLKRFYRVDGVVYRPKYSPSDRYILVEESKVKNKRFFIFDLELKRIIKVIRCDEAC